MDKINPTIGEAFDYYINSCKIRGLADDTLKHYEDEFHKFTKVINADTKCSDLSVHHIEGFILTRMDEVKNVSINTTLRTIRGFITWAGEREHLEPFKVTMLKEGEVIKETYSKSELKALLRRPDMSKVSFPTYRNWVVINYLVGTGNRLRSIVNIKIGDLHLDESYLILTTTKNRKGQVVPLVSQLVSILREYLQYRGGDDDDYLFCSATGEQLTRGGLYHAIKRYNISRGVAKTSIHAFRHTFAKMSIVDCNMDSFRLQRLMGHSDIATTQKYVKIFADDLIEDVDKANPLSILSMQGKHIKMR